MVSLRMKTYSITVYGKRFEEEGTDVWMETKKGRFPGQRMGRKKGQKELEEKKDGKENEQENKVRNEESSTEISLLLQKT